MKSTVHLWTITAILLGFFVLTHLGVMVSFLTSHALLPWIAPLALGLALWMGDRLGQRDGLQGKARLVPLGVSLGLIVLAIGVASLFYDLSWDGLWYHQVGIFALEEGWNPLAEPMREFTDHNQDWVRHYAKGPWYIAAALFKTFGSLEAGKCINGLAMAIMFMAVLAACLDGGMRRARAVTVATLVSLNPVVCLESVSYLVDGLMVSYLAVICAVFVRCLHKPTRLVAYVGVTAAICMINTKFTGLVFLCFFCAAGGIYCLIQRRDLIWRYATLTAITIVLGTFVWGYNPYVTNTLHRGHPFYPQLGTKEYPGLVGQENDGIEKYETPHNMQGRSRWFRMAYSVFARPGNAPFNDQPNAQLMWPFTARVGDMAVYKFHEARISGFGPYFSGVLVLSFGLLVWILASRNSPRCLLVLACMTLLVTLFISKHLWWARYGPQMWLLPLVPMVAAFGLKRSRPQVVLAWILCGILGVNALITATVHLRWEIMATRTLHRQLTELRDSGREIEVNFRWFGDTFSRRLNDWGIPYRQVHRREVQDGPELMSVVQGYPGAVHYRFVEDGLSNLEDQTQ